MVSSPPKIFNPAAQSHAHRRATRRTARNGLSFLYQRAALDAASRLGEVNRVFERALLVGPTDGRAAILETLPEDRRPKVFEHQDNARALIGDYDAIISLLDLQSDEALPDTLKTLRQYLRPDGLMLIGFFGGESLTELRQSLYATDQALLGGAAARCYPMVDYKQSAALLGQAGLALPVVDIDKVQVHYSTLSRLVADLRDLGLTNTLQARDRRRLPRRYMDALTENYAAHFAREDGKLRASFEILWLTGWAPHKSQPKPLKPGSAKIHLSEALKRKTPPTG